MSRYFFERSWQIFEEMNAFRNRLERDIDFMRMDYSLEELDRSVRNLRHEPEIERLVEEKLQVTRLGECEEKIKAMDTEQFIAFHKEVMEDWEDRKRSYDETVTY